MQDQAVVDRINELAHQEHDLHTLASKRRLTDGELVRRDSVRILLDQWWDLLHQRRALRNAGMDPGAARVRDERVVEGYVA